MSAKTKTPVQTSQTITSHTAKHEAAFAIPVALRIRLFCGLLLLAISASAVAQTHFCIGGDLDAMNAGDVAACQAKMSGVRDAVKSHGAPADWHFVVVCDEAGWKDYTSFSRHEAGLLAGASYSTDPQLRWTFLRGSELNAEQPLSVAGVVSMALESVPSRKSAPQLPAPGRATRQFGVAMANGSSSQVISR